MTQVERPKEPTSRVTVQNIADWQKIRMQHDQFCMDSKHNLIHVIKATGPVAALLEHRDHREPDVPVEDKRLADLIIHSVWLVESLGKNAAELVANRMWEIGIKPKREELPPEERK